MSQEQELTRNSLTPFSITMLERGESLVAFCNTCKRVICKGSNTRISELVMNNQIETHLAAFRLHHWVEIIPRGL